MYSIPRCYRCYMLENIQACLTEHMNMNMNKLYY